MTEIWPREVSRKIQIQNRFQIFRKHARREKSRQNQVDLGVDLGGTRSTGDSTPGSTWGSTCLVGPRQPGAPVLLLGSVLEACDDSGWLGFDLGLILWPKTTLTSIKRPLSLP